MSTEEPLRTLIQRFSGLRFHSPVFSPDLEREYTEDADIFRRRRQWLEGLCSICLYVVLALTTPLLFPGRPSFESQLRFAFVIPLLMLVNISMRTDAARWLRETAILVASGVAGSLEIVFQTIHPGHSEYSVHLTIVLFLLFTNTVMRLRPSFAAVAFGWGIGAEFLMIAVEHGNAPQTEILQAGMVLAIGLFTLVGNYSQDREARLAFLRSAQKAELIGALAKSNEHLAAVAMTDSLTGLANRSSLDIYLSHLWSQASVVEVECSMIMIDIDHFKSLNDRYGHLYGDRVIKRVARLLSEALRGEYDFIARYGGEEFLLVLPRTPVRDAALVAERLRSVVQLAGLPSLGPGEAHLQGVRATISCGVAGGAPQFYADPYSLIGAADEALYRAKRDGRNVVRNWLDPTENMAFQGNE